MSYTVIIRRPDDRPILEAEVRGLVSGDGELAFPPLADADPGELLFHWTRPGQQPVGFLLSHGQIGSTTTPSDEAVAKMQQLAKVLDAVVEGEDGEDLTNVEMPAGRVAGHGAGCYVFALLTFLAVAAWLLFFRPAA